MRNAVAFALVLFFAFHWMHAETINGEQGGNAKLSPASVLFEEQKQDYSDRRRKEFKDGLENTLKDHPDLTDQVRSTKKACNSSTMPISAPIALLGGRECYAYHLFSSHGNLHCS
jgi:hypothetical protein